MTEKIINDVNVAGCSLYLKDNGKCLRLLTDNEPETECNAICDYGCLYHKEQLTRLEQENRELKAALEEIKNDLKEVCKEECDYTKPKFCGDCDCRYGQILDKINEVLND